MKNEKFDVEEFRREINDLADKMFFCIQERINNRSKDEIFYFGIVFPWMTESKSGKKIIAGWEGIPGAHALIQVVDSGKPPFSVDDGHYVITMKEAEERCQIWIENN